MQWGPLSVMSGKALLPPPLALFLPTPCAVASAAGAFPAHPSRCRLCRWHGPSCASTQQTAAAGMDNRAGTRLW